jgi:hypothetical protein
VPRELTSKPTGSVSISDPIIDRDPGDEDNVGLDVRDFQAALVLLKDAGHLPNVTFGKDPDTKRFVRGVRRLNPRWQPGRIPNVPFQSVRAASLPRAQADRAPRSRPTRSSQKARSPGRKDDDPEPDPLAPVITLAELRCSVSERFDWVEWAREIAWRTEGVVRSPGAIAALENARLAVEFDPIRRADHVAGLRLAAAVTLATRVEVCEALLAGVCVPAKRLDPAWVHTLDLAGDVVLDEELALRVNVHGPLYGRRADA